MMTVKRTTWALSSWSQLPQTVPQTESDPVFEATCVKSRAGATVPR